MINLFSYDGSGFSTLSDSNYGHSHNGASIPRFLSQPLVAGGNDEFGWTLKSEIMDTATGTWSMIPDYPTGTL